MKHFIFLFISMGLCLGTAFAKDNVTWGYEGKVGPEYWGDLSPSFLECKTGKMQAPIDIPSKQAKPQDSKIQTFYKASRAKVINNGHSIQINLPNAGFAELDGEDYSLLQIHFHAPGEEKVDGKSYPFNAHLVHLNPGDSEYDSEAGKLAVIGIFFKEGKANTGLTKIFDNLPAQKSKTPFKGEFDVRSILPRDMSFYSYDGSLTTPGCAEGVRFYILKTPLEMSKAQLEQFKKLYPMNARPVQPINGRPIVQSK